MCGVSEWWDHLNTAMYVAGLGEEPGRAEQVFQEN